MNEPTRNLWDVTKVLTFFCFNGKPAPIGVTLMFTLKKQSLVVVSNIFYFHPYLGKISNLTYIFQMGWNHQPESNLPIQNDELFDFRQNWKIKGCAPRKRWYMGHPHRTARGWRRHGFWSDWDSSLVRTSKAWDLPKWTKHIFSGLFISVWVSAIKDPGKTFPAGTRKNEGLGRWCSFSYRCFQVPCSFSDDICVYIYIYIYTHTCRYTVYIQLRWWYQVWTGQFHVTLKMLFVNWPWRAAWKSGCHLANRKA